MYVFTQRLFPYQLGTARAGVRLCSGRWRARWCRWAPRAAALWLAYPLALFAIGFLHEEERSQLGELLRPSAIAARARALRAETAPANAEAGETEPLGPEV